MIVQIRRGYGDGKNVGTIWSLMLSFCFFFFADSYFLIFYLNIINFV